MKIDVTEKGFIRIKELFNVVILETQEGVKFPICMRDDGLEIGILDDSIKHDGLESYYTWYTIKSSGIELLNNIGCKKELENVKNNDNG